ncbi:EAL domain-containing protein [Thalassospira sp. TSL5-1]|uniref:sensor domain-containing phosphodiesterase n=1 Tax=Thalassospira sp. TSL5-1 TaxID=1544451 RepID=UPI00093D41CB|nr:EAL domain-containing protein [Thalassospira sp. TSL5-1]
MTEHFSAEFGETDRDLLAAMAFCWADMLLEVDENGHVIFAAGAIKSLLGCPPERLVGEALEHLVIPAERPLLRAYLHGDNGVKRLEELDIEFKLPANTEPSMPGVLPVSISGYLISDPIARYFLAIRHRPARPRARLGIDRLILQQGIAGRSRLPGTTKITNTGEKTLPEAATTHFANSSQTAPRETAHTDTTPGHHNHALIVLENLAAARSRAETRAANELAAMIRERSRNGDANRDAQNAAGIHEPMIELERRIVAYASALRSDDPAFAARQNTAGGNINADNPHSEYDPQNFAIDENTLAALNALDTLDDAALASSLTAFQTENGIDKPVFEGPDYEVARAVHHQQTVAGDIFATNLTRAVAYALNRLHSRRDHPDDVSAEKLSASLPGLIQETMKSVRAFREIVKNGSFAIALQPIVGLNDEKIHHYEALARFTGTDDTIAIDQIIHFAEGTGLITEFDLAMSRKVLEYMQSNACPAGIHIAINLSGHSLEQPDFDTALLDVLGDFAIDPALVYFEVTETARITNLHQVNKTLQKLRVRGHMVCLDDFGAGAANFEYLSALDVDVIKFDGRAMQTALATPKGRAFLKATASLCHDLNILTIAEMIHDMDTFTTLRDLGIDFGQGYHLGHPEAIGHAPKNRRSAAPTAAPTASSSAGDRR